MVMLDYSKAYDRVWRQELLLEMIEVGVPLQMVRWFRSFLENRTAQVLYNGSYSKRVHLCQGLPQGAVSSPLLFLIYIDSLSEAIPEEMENSLFASVLIQLALDQIANWSAKKKMDLNVAKCEVTFFSPSSHEAKWRPKVTLFGDEVPFNPTPKFLGVYLDRTLSFQKHVEYATHKASDRCKILSSLASKKWGWRKESLRKVYLTTQRSVLDYAAPAWQPWLSETQSKRLETAQNKALRLVTGQYASTPVEALRLEAGVVSYKTHSTRLTAISAEKAVRLPADHPAASPSSQTLR